MLHDFIQSSDPDIICLNEHCFSEEYANYAFSQFKNFNTIYSCRNNRSGGGTAIMIKNTLRYTSVKWTTSHAQFNEIEAVAATIEAANFTFTVISYYNPPDILINNDFLNWIDNNFNNFVLFGDLNAKSPNLNCLTKNTNSNGRALNEFLCESASVLLNTEKEATHRSNSYFSNDKLDYCLASPSLTSKLIHQKVSFDTQCMSDHAVLAVTFKLSPIQTKAQVGGHKFNFNKANWNKFANLLDSPSNELILSCANIDYMESQVVEALIDAKKAAIPTRNNFYSNEKPADYITLIRSKRKARRIMQATKSAKISMELNFKALHPDIVNFDEFLKSISIPSQLGEKYDEILSKYKTEYSEYSKLERAVKELNKSLANQNWDKFIDRVGPRPTTTTPFWQRINRFRNKPESNSIATLIYNNMKCSEDDDKCNAFADHLQKTFSTDPDNNFNNEQKLEIDQFIQNTPLAAPTAREHFSMAELNKTIDTLNNKISSDKQGLCNRMLKHLPESFKRIILDLFNRCLVEGDLPASWKLSQVSMIKKKADDFSSVKSYRPISITSYLAKLNERLILNRLINSLTNNNTLAFFQSGFRKHRQTKDNIMFIVQKVLESFDRNLGKNNKFKWRVCGVFFDIASAFDKVWHNGLLYKLIKAKIPEYIIRWIRSFLENRRFEVKVNDVTSTARPIACGVPQGSVLSPVLFSLFINDIPSRSNKNKNQSLLFADDLCHLELFNKPSQAQDNINTYLIQLEAWLKAWRLKMAPHKCAYIIFNNSDNTHDLNLRLGGESITRTTETTFLGIVLDEKLNFSSHLEKIQEACKKRTNIIKILAHPSWKLNLQTLRQLYFALVRSLFEYSSILAPALTKTRLQSVQILQNAALRAMLRQPRATPIDILQGSAGVVGVADRLSLLVERYLVGSIVNKNPLLIKLCEEFFAYRNGRTTRKTTLLDPHRTTIQLALDSSRQVVSVLT
jgi:exonuclease III